VTKKEQEIHARWANSIPSNRDTGDPCYREEWYLEQCGNCRHWISLEGPLGADWGVCSNGDSTLDGHVMFEHDGCDSFETATGASDGKDDVLGPTECTPPRGDDHRSRNTIL